MYTYKTSIQRGFSIAMFDYPRVLLNYGGYLNGNRPGHNLIMYMLASLDAMCSFSQSKRSVTKQTKNTRTPCCLRHF